MEKRTELFGKFKTWQMRLQSYISLITFFMIFYVFIQENKWLEWYVWLTVFVIVIGFIIYLDVTYIFPAQLNYTFNKTGKFREILDVVSSNSDKLDFLMEKIK